MAHLPTSVLPSVYLPLAPGGLSITVAEVDARAARERGQSRDCRDDDKPASLGDDSIPSPLKCRGTFTLAIKLLSRKKNTIKVANQDLLC